MYEFGAYVYLSTSPDGLRWSAPVHVPGTWVWWHKNAPCGGAEAVGDRSFTALVTNPPFHQERATTYTIAEQIVRDAAALLRRRGRLYLVANAFLKYEPVIQEAFGNVELLRQTNRFKVWYATKRK